MLTLVSAPGDDDRDSFAVFDGERCVGHIMRTGQSPQGKPWFWTIFAHGVPSMPDRGYAATREQAMADFESEWLRL
jgi:alkylated DNA nucleotide flippase Atl1